MNTVIHVQTYVEETNLPRFKFFHMWLLVIIQTPLVTKHVTRLYEIQSRTHCSVTWSHLIIALQMVFYELAERLQTKPDVWLTVHRNSVWIRNQIDVTFVLSFISLLQVAQHVSGNHVPIFKS